MYRYVALAWDADDAEACGEADRASAELSSQWTGARRALDDHGLRVFVSSEAADSWQTLVQSRQGVIVGRVFRSGRESEESTPTTQEWARIGTTQGRSLLESWWGRYVAIFHTGLPGGISILRDPSSGLPCSICRHRTVWVIFSDIAVCKRLVPLSVDWQHVGEFLRGGNALSPQTGLANVTEVQAGERVTLTRNGMQRSTPWDPLESAINDPVERPGEAVAALRETVDRCVSAWASLHPSIVHMLSGGLDSSIVLSCLSRAPSRPHVTCLHVVSSAKHESERHYARMAAAHMRCELRELTIESCAANLSELMPRVRPGVRPLSTIYEALTSESCANLAAEMSSTAITSGAAGDSLFLQPAAEFAVPDYVCRHGLRADVWRVACNAARVSGQALWPVLWRAISKRALRRNLEHFFDIPHVSGSSTKNRDSRVPPGLAVHLSGMSASVPFYGAFEQSASEPDRCPVLLSQPVMELCLRIPSHVWISGGCDRSLLRQAFASHLPGAIVRRTAKGAANDCYRDVLDLNAEFVRRELLGGRLAAEGWIDPRWITSQLAATSLRGLEYERILHRYLCAEFWLRHWQEPQPAVLIDA